MSDLIPAGTRVKYWGQATGPGGASLYGTEFTVQWANQCGCKHQTYSIINDAGKQLSQVLGDNLRVVE